MLRRKMRRTGSFSFRGTLPGEVDADKIEANLADGVLSVKVPKAEVSKSRRIEIK